MAPTNGTNAFVRVCATLRGVIVTLHRIVLMVCLAFSLQSSSLLAQKNAETCDVPVVVADFYNQLVPNLEASDFSIRFAGVPGVVQSASSDRGPKRIVLVLDASANTPEDEWELEVETAETLLEHARRSDLFALSAIGGEATEASFLSSEDILDRVRKLPHSGGPERTYDALWSAVKDLKPAQFGDAILLIGHDEDHGSTVTFNELREPILKSRLRFYGISFADKLAKLPRGYDLNKPLPSGFGLSKLESLSTDTGYFFSFFAVHILRMPGQIPGFKNYLGDLYAGMAEPYRLSIKSPDFKDQTTVSLQVTEMEARRVHEDGIHYPHRLFPCGVPPSVR